MALLKVKFQYFLSTDFLCIVKEKNVGWYLENTLFNPEKNKIERFILLNNFLHSK